MPSGQGGNRAMRLTGFVRTLFGLLPILGVAALGGGCDRGSQGPVDQGKQSEIRASKKAAHRQIQENAAKSQGPAARKGARRGVAGR